MRIHKLTIHFCIFILTMFIANTVYAANSTNIKFFISNNTQEINLEKAYERTTNQFQAALTSSTIHLLQQNHIEQGRLENVLGAYQMASDKYITGDNTEIFLASPYQPFSDDLIFSLSRQLVDAFQQESIAVFIPSNQSAIGDVIVKFNSNKPSIAAVIQLIHEKLPSYTNAFSLHVANNYASFNDASVAEIEWLGSKININKIMSAFPRETISYSRGRAYLVYKNGQIEAI